jgi:hypothetical protein
VVRDEGFGALGAAVDGIRDDLAEVRRSIEGQDLLDEVDDSTDDQRFFDRLVAVDREAARLEVATEWWIGKALNLGGGKRDGALRFSVRTRNPPLITASDVARLGYDSFSRGYVADRADAGTRGRVVLRPGQPLVDGAYRLCELGSRGAAFAGLIEHAQLQADHPPIPFFFFDVLVEPAIPDELPEGQPRWWLVRNRAWRHLAPTIHATWHTPGVGEPPRAVQRDLAAKAVDLAEDVTRFEELTAGIDWVRTCRQAEERAIAMAAARIETDGLVERALRRLDAEEAQLSARRAIQGRVAGDGSDAAGLADTFEPVHRAIIDPAMRIDTCGVVFVVPKA